MSPTHVPVMTDEVLSCLDPRPGDTIVDATIGLGGHAVEISRRIGPAGTLLGIDRDRAALAMASERLAEEPARALCFAARFSELGRVVREADDPPEASIDGILFDLGVSSMQLDLAERGFSFQLDGPLDMRMDQERGPSAADFLNSAPVREIESVLRRFGEERAARRIASAIDRARSVRRLATTSQLAEIVASVLPRGGQKLHPATRTFQAIRIAVNAELDLLEEVLRDLDRWLAPGGAVAILAYHSLEDRIVKRSLGRHVADGLMDWSFSGVAKPTADEISSNPRSRSARLRCARRIGARRH